LNTENRDRKGGACTSATKEGVRITGECAHRCYHSWSSTGRVLIVTVLQSWLKIFYKYGGRRTRIVRSRANSKTGQRYKKVSWNKPDMLVVCLAKLQNTESTYGALISVYVLFYD
jgi:hypothetical protein